MKTLGRMNNFTSVPVPCIQKNTYKRETFTNIFFGNKQVNAMMDEQQYDALRIDVNREDERIRELNNNLAN